MRTIMLHEIRWLTGEIRYVIEKARALKSTPHIPVICAVRCKNRRLAFQRASRTALRCKSVRVAHQTKSRITQHYKAAIVFHPEENALAFSTSRHSSIFSFHTNVELKLNSTSQSSPTPISTPVTFTVYPPQVPQSPCSSVNQYQLGVPQKRRELGSINLK